MTLGTGIAVGAMWVASAIILGLYQKDMITQTYTRWKYHARWRFRRLRLGLKFAFGTMTPLDAQNVMYDCCPIAGHEPLVVLSLEDTMDDALDRFKPHPQLEDYLADGVMHVGGNYECHGDELYEARRWAIDKAVEYAEADGITFEPVDEEVAA